MRKKTTITLQMKEYGAEDRYSSEPQKAHLTVGEFVIVAKFGGHALRHLAKLASRLAPNV